jgi:hypothetical protein
MQFTLICRRFHDGASVWYGTEHSLYAQHVWVTTGGTLVSNSNATWKYKHDRGRATTTEPAGSFNNTETKEHSSLPHSVLVAMDGRLGLVRAEDGERIYTVGHGASNEEKGKGTAVGGGDKSSVWKHCQLTWEDKAHRDRFALAISGNKEQKNEAHSTIRSRTPLVGCVLDEMGKGYPVHRR